VWVTGEYDVWVHNRSGEPDFGVSEAVVKVFQGQSLVAEYAVSDEPGVENTELDIWRVLNLMISDEEGTLELNREGHGFLGTILEPVTEPSLPACP
jgi:hypothetical protein